MTVAGPLLWHACGTTHASWPRRAKVRVVTHREQASVAMHGQ
jgi:hypothetical protein